MTDKQNPIEITDADFGYCGVMILAVVVIVVICIVIVAIAVHHQKDSAIPRAGIYSGITVARAAGIEVET